MSHHTLLHLVRAIALALVIYFIVAYLIMPALDKRRSHRHPDPADGERFTHTSTGLQGDPLNVAVVGAEHEFIRAVIAAGWYAADPLTFDSSARIVIDTVLKRPDDEAPVSNLYLFGRREDLGFEKPIGDSPRARHHVRFWRSPKTEEGRTLWVGSAAQDLRVEFSRTTGEITHRIAPDIDAERDLFVADLAKVVPLKTRWIDGFHKELHGVNGGGDPWTTDGRLLVAILPESPLQPTPSP